MKIVLNLLVLTTALSDITFIFHEGVSPHISWGILMFGLLLGGIFSLLTIRQIVFSPIKRETGTAVYVLRLLIVFACISSLYLAINKKSLDWDSVALYDARAIFMSHGIKFSEMLKLSSFDNLNSYYYLLYPPYTTILHFWWKIFGLGMPTVIYSGFLAILSIGVYSLTKENLGDVFAGLITLLIITNNKIFGLSLFEYTNLPYATFICIGIFLLLKYLREKKWQILFVSAYIYSSAVNIRFSEPTIPSLLITTLTVYFLTKKTIYIRIFTVFSLLLTARYLSWSIFTVKIAGMENFIHISHITIIESVIGAFIGTLADYSVVFLRSSSSVLVPVIASLVAPTKDEADGDHVLFLKMYAAITLIIYFAGFYLLSFANYWWKSVLEESLSRSTIFLIPISAYILLNSYKRNIS